MGSVVSGGTLALPGEANACCRMYSGTVGTIVPFREEVEKPSKSRIQTLLLMEPLFKKAIKVCILSVSSLVPEAT